ncbi:2Fe-2S iron-sulfur cluster binding domain-containing protein [Epidermidibacterium keratini]|uniref:2Fe-2S iron-sulfur cluster binding domain-containing protein n=1 Tax=Epidermidibacterium keratini TaxID=1891644 RepID=A0A7L4YP69_9ACTN|nr:PDR/VanB family oxidoreductase [Epidermidibacterium keratini]QHC01081.1 2Fe-2S iron-sulfur cluster binding domain-containing protein [Epidermidibacterium keratini]
MTQSTHSTPATLAPASQTELALSVLSKQTESDGVVSLLLGHPDGRRLPDWTPGSHIDLMLPSGLTRQYSLCGDRQDPSTYRVAVLRERDGRGGSAYVHEHLREGEQVRVGGPRNNFNLVPAQRYLFIAGGIGITPIVAMIEAAERLGAQWSLLYGGRTRDSLAFADELIAKYGDRVRLHPQDELGLLPIADYVGEPAPGTVVYCCGPAPLLSAVAEHTVNWPTGTVRTEKFVASTPNAPVRNDPFEVVLARSGTSVTVGPERSVLDAVRDAGAPILSSCEQGLCGTCETGVLEGTPDHRDSLLDDDERQRGDCMFICVSRSCGDRLVLDL